MDPVRCSTCPSSRDHANGRNRRISPVAVRPGEGLLSDHIAGAQPWRRELVFLPRSCRSKVADQNVSESAASVRRERSDGSRVKKEAAAAASDRFDEFGITLGRFSRQPRSRGSGRASHCRCRQHVSPPPGLAPRHNPRHRRTRPGRTGCWSGG